MTGLFRFTLFVALVTVALSAGSPFVEAKIKGGPQEPPPDVAPLSLEKPEPQFPVGTQWSLAAINGKPVGSDPPSFTLDDKLRATGFSGCNTYSMPLYPIKGQKLAAGGIALTRKECDKDVMLLERTFLVTMHSLPVWSTEGDDLVVKLGPTTLRFHRGL